MGFDILLADDPRFAPDFDWDSPEAVDALVPGPRFSVPNRTMSELRAEMAAQDFAILGAFLFNNDDWVTSKEIDADMERASDDPITILDAEGIELWREFLAFLRFASREHGGVVVG